MTTISARSRCASPSTARLRVADRWPWAYLRDVLQRLPTQRSSQIEDLLPARWQPASDAAP
ncbi:transposase domain-containing protein [Variovorax sp. V116]|uniref:transposase domain-containing protein n=1 Tax=Variovorax sp. V116 TaxID=3065953 RepID=UPI0034E83C34